MATLVVGLRMLCTVEIVRSCDEKSLFSSEGENDFCVAVTSGLW